MRVRCADGGKREAILATSRVHKGWKIFAITSVILGMLVISPLAYFAHYHPNAFQAINKNLQVSDTFSSHFEAMPYRLKSIISKIDTVSIDLKHVDVQKLEYMRQQAMAGKKSFEYVPAVIRYNDKNIKVKMRLKGDRSIHFEDKDTASYRIKIKDDDTLFGMKSFSAHKPRSRNYLYEWVYLRLMERAGIITPQYKFVNINLNGQSLGLYALEEHYDKYLIERHHRREGPIIRFKEETVNKNYALLSKYYETPVVPYDEKTWGKQENLPMTKTAIYLLEGYRQGKLTVSQVFDIEKLAMFFALTDLTGNHHGSVPKSLRFYYNPITSRLEPIPFDGHFGTIQQPILTSEIGVSPSTWLHLYWKEYFISFFNDPERLDPEFIRAYISALEKVSSATYLDDFFDQTKEEFNQAHLATYNELPLKDDISSFGPEAFKFDKGEYYKRRKYINDKLSQPTINAHIAEQNNQQIIVEANILDRQFPSKVLSLNCGKTTLIPTPETAYLVGTRPLNEVEIHKIRFIFKASQAGSIQFNKCGQLNFQTLGRNDIYTAKVYPWASYEHKFVANDVSRSIPNYANFNFIHIDASSKILSISQGSHTISHNLILPPGYTVVAGPKTTLSLINGALIYSYSALNFTGTKENPIVITSGDGTGQGLAVIQATGSSHLKHVKFTNLSYPSQKGWFLPGSVTFYESPVNMSSVTVQNNKSEDAINIVRSSFNIDHLNVTDTFGDALDVDFGEGKISESYFENLGNDALDFSGAKVRLEKIEILNASDKGISAGEASRVSAQDIKMDGNILGVASKDKSYVSIVGLNVANSAIALTAYQKKSEFGPGKVFVKNFKYDGEGLKSLIEKGSLLVIDNKEYPGQQLDVSQLISNVSAAKTSQ